MVNTQMLRVIEIPSDVIIDFHKTTSPHNNPTALVKTSNI
jgi:hypothetical protein